MADDLFPLHDIHRAQVIAELRTKATELAPAGRNAFPGICGTSTTIKDGVVGPEVPCGLYDEPATLKCTAGVFLRMLDAVEGVERYQPSNGTEGERFMARFCDRCTKDDDESCEIIAYTMCLDLDDPDYPREWRQDGPEGPRCTAFEPKE